jgi:hypothetical protein
MWTFLGDENAWRDYTAEYATDNIPSQTPVIWQQPAEYPCLVVSHTYVDHQARRRVASAFVYRADVAFFSAKAGTGVKRRDGFTQENFNTYTQANLRAIVRELIKIGVTTPERYEAVLAECLEEVRDCQRKDLDVFKALYSDRQAG